MQSVFEQAYAEGRDSLSERELYEMLAALGLDVPKHELIPDDNYLAGRIHDIENEYPERVVLKIASPDIHHKTETGGVAVVDNRADAIAGAFDAIIAGAGKAMPEARIDGALLLEHVEIEHELLVSIIDDPTFGHMLTVGRGGTLAEVFKDIAMRPAPVEKPHIEAMLKSLKTYPLLQGYRGAKEADIGRIVDSIATISSLARMNKRNLKGFDPFRFRFDIAELEINPLAVTKDGRVLPLDGILRFCEAKERTHESVTPDVTHLDKLFHPKTIALVGASDKAEKMGGSILKNLIHGSIRKQGGGGAAIFPVNPKHDELMGLKACKSLSDIPEPIDLAVLAIPAEFTPPVVAECARAKVKMAVVISGGFGEMGEEGRKMEAEMRDTARKAGMRLIGPNCMGVYFEPTNFSTFFLSSEKTVIPRGDVNNYTVLSQSGAVGVQLIQLARNVGVRSVVSYGNMIDVDVADLMAYFEGDEGTDVIGLYVEGLTNGARFIAAAKKMTKPVIIMKAGRTRAGSAATVSHTGSIAGDYDVAKAVFSATGLIEAPTLQDLADYVKAFAFLSARVPKGRRIGVVSNAGGLGVLAADATAGTCLEMARFSRSTVEKMTAEARHYVTTGNPVDLGPGVTDEEFLRAVAHILDDENVDALVALPGIQPYPMRPDHVVDGIIELNSRCSVPMVVAITPAEERFGLFDRLEAARVPHYDTPERAVRALAAYLAYHARERE